MTRKERKAWEKKFKPFHETREKEKRLSENEIYCRLYYALLEPERVVH